MISQTWWYLARASGIVAWLMLTASVLWGIVLSTKAFPRHRRPAWLLDLHRWLGGLTLALVALHIGSLVADSYVQFDPVQVLVPFTSTWRPFAVALGIVAMWLLLAVQLSSLAIKQLPRRVWHGVHLASYATFVLTVGHAFLAGSDRTQPLFVATGALGVLAVAWATVYRITHPKPARRAAATRRDVTRPVPTGPSA